MKAVLQYRASPGFQNRIVAQAPDWLDVVIVDEAEKDAFATEMRDADVLLHVLEPVTVASIKGAPSLALIQKIGVGVNTIDLETARKREVAVCNMPGTNSRAVAEMTLALMLSALRRVPFFDRLMRRGEGWTTPLEAFDRTGEVAGRTVGLIGYGEVARLIAPVLSAMGATVLYTATAPKDDAVADWRSLEALLAEADILSLHVPLTPDTEKIIDAAAIDWMKSDAIIVNTARGGLIDEAAMVKALKSGKLRAAGLDVLTVEPAPAGNPLFELENVVLMPHVAWLTPETLDRSLGIAFENCRRLKDGEELLYRVA